MRITTRPPHRPSIVPPERPLRLGTRSSALALWQAEHVAERLRRAGAAEGVAVELVEISTLGDRDLARPIAELGSAAPFADDVERALAAGFIDLAVHSLKDLEAPRLEVPPSPPASAPALVIAAVLERADPGETLVSRLDRPLAELPAGAHVGTSSPRRAAQVLALRPDLAIAPIRGPVDDRVRQVRRGDFEAAVLAAAGLARLGRLDEACERFALDRFLPAPAQGALAVQVRSDDPRVARRVQPLDHRPTRRAVTAELELLERVGETGGLVLAAVAEAVPETTGAIRLRARLLEPGGRVVAAADLTGEDPRALARAAERRLRRAVAA